MEPERWRQIEELYHAARERAPGEREALLAQASAEVRGKVEALLAQDASGEKILDRPAWEAAPSFLGQPGSLIDQPTQMIVGPGAQFGPYKIEASIGAGGMGEVYRAVDTRLGRKVAIKIGSKQFSERFEREARAISAMNHPHICTLYDVGPNYLVMELVEGETLAAAHAKGIIHRDLKPGNVMVTKQGVKVLDFGLARTQGDETLTVSRAIMGTPAYMAPEQREGKDCDARTDIYAFGCVLYEMLTGKRVGQDRTPVEPPALESVLGTCLEKDPEDRWQSARELKHALGWAVGQAPPERVRRSRPLPWAVAAVMTVAAAGVAGYFLTRPAPLALTSQFTVDSPPDTIFTNQFAATAISPDGRFLVFSAAVGSAATNLRLRPFDSLAARSVPGTEGGNFPFWSPDSKSIAFFASGKLKRIDVEGGAPLVLCDAPIAGNGSVGGAWNRDGVILLGAPDGLHRVLASGGVPMLLTKADAAGQELGHGYPQYLPDGKRFLYFVQSGNSNTQGIYAGSLDRPQDRVQILRTDAKALYEPAVASHPGYLLWLREQTLLAQRFGAATLRLEGDPTPLAEDIALNGNRAAFWTSGAGLLVYRTGGNYSKAKLVWIGRDGRPLGNAGPEDSYASLRLSPDGKRAAVGRRDPAGYDDTWLLEFGRGVFTRFTFDPKDDTGPVWSPDGRQIAFSSNRSGFYQLYRKDSAGAGQEEQLTSGPSNKTLSDWSRDGRYLLYTGRGKGGDDLMALPLEGERKPMGVLQTPFNEGGGMFSPDGKWVAYYSNESGQDEAYVRAFSPAAPSAGGKWQVSNQGGMWPRWRSDGKELFYLNLRPTRMMAAGIRMTATGVETDTPHELFRISVNAGITSPYDVTPDGQRFLVEEVSVAEHAAPLTVVTNWRAGLK
ncbi:MAG TPA: protein kinase [Bryobacteraceae bacterium]|nr:protein kinase [Bryobacteraceae bacterium]